VQPERCEAGDAWQEEIDVRISELGGGRREKDWKMAWGLCSMSAIG